jgi:hypothetical protein
VKLTSQFDLVLRLSIYGACLHSPVFRHIVMLVGSQGRLLKLVDVYWSCHPLTEASLARKHAPFVSGWFSFLYGLLLIQVAIQKRKDQDIKNYNFAREFVWV